MRRDLLASLFLFAATVVVCCVLYPLAVFSFAALAAPNARHGSLIANDQGRIVGSRLIAQGFTRPEYFWPRPSACDYNAAAAAGSNLSPASPVLRERVEKAIAQLNGGDAEVVPADLVTASGGGLDPHISYAAALFQAERVAKARRIDENEVRRLIDLDAEQLPFTADEMSRIVNVLELNIALDNLSRRE